MTLKTAMRGVDACSQPGGSESDQDPLDQRIVTVTHRDEIEDAMKVYKGLSRDAAGVDNLTLTEFPLN